MTFIDDMFNDKGIDKEAAISQGTDAKDHFDRKVQAHPWVESILELDPVKVDKEYQEAQAAEARLLGKTAAYEMDETMDKTIEKDYQRDVKILSDYALAEMIAELRCSKAQNTNEMFYEEKEKAKKEVASSREKAEKALLDMVPTHTMLDWHKAFERFSKEAKPEEAKEKDLFQPVAPEKAHDFEHPTEEKFKTPKDQDKAIPGNGREADERTEVTAEAGVLQADITKGLGKEASVNTEAHCGSCPGDPGVKATAELCPVCGTEGQDLGDLKQKDHFSCMACGIRYSHKEGSCGHCASLNTEIEAKASKEEVLKIIKKAEVESPWAVITDESGKEVMARVAPEISKESEEEHKDELKK